MPQYRSEYSKYFCGCRNAIQNIPNASAAAAIPFGIFRTIFGYCGGFLIAIKAVWTKFGKYRETHPLPYLQTCNNDGSFGLLKHTYGNWGLTQMICQQ